MCVFISYAYSNVCCAVLLQAKILHRPTLDKLLNVDYKNFFIKIT